MKAFNIYNDKNIKHHNRSRLRGTTAYYIFDQDEKYQFKVDRVHFKMKSGTYQAGIVHSGSMKELRQVQIALVPTAGPIIDISDYYADGATISIEDPKVAIRIYKRILDHLDAHMHSMQTNIHYEPPQDNVLKELSEFATAIRYKALEEDPLLDQLNREFEQVNSLRESRAFIGMSRTTINIDPAKVPVKSIEKMDSIERYLAMLEGHNG